MKSAPAPHRSADPWGWYQELLTLPGPHCEDRTFYVARYHDVRNGLRHPDLAVGFPFRATRQLFGPTAIDLDAPQHRPARKQVNWFTAAHMRAWNRKIIAPTVRDLIHTVQPGQSLDAVRTFGQALPTRVISRIIGLPEHEWPYLWHQLRPIVNYIADQRSSLQAALTARDALVDRLNRAMATGAPPHSLLSRLPPDRPPPTRDRPNRLGPRIRTLLLLLAAGTETTTAAIGNLLTCLVHNPDTWEDIAAGTTPADAAVTETLRLYPPLHTTVRFAVRQLTLNATTIPEESNVHLLLAAANRDPTVFDQPNTWQTNRPAQPIHSFGGGPHACVGAQLALSEMRQLIQGLTSHFVPPRLHNQLTYHKTPFHQPAQLLLSFTDRTTHAQRNHSP
jgi:cytochrome P450